MRISVDLDSGYSDNIRRNYKYFHRNNTINTFPKNCPHSDLLEMRGQEYDHSCGLELALLALTLQRINHSDSDVTQAIKMSKEGTDPDNLYWGLCALGVYCAEYEDMTARLFKPMLERHSALYIWCGQQPVGSKKNHLKQRVSGHFLGACCSDRDYAYFVDPGYPKGKTRILWNYLDLLWYDQNNQGKKYKGHMIEVPYDLY